MRISDWSSDVCSSDLRLHRQVGEVGVVARLPQLRTVLLPSRPFEICAAVVARDLANQLGLLAGARLGAVELEEQRRLHRIVELGVVIDRLHLQLVEQLDAGDRRTEEHTSELQSLMRISYVVLCSKKQITSL